MKPRSYADAGVDIEGGDRFASYIAGLKSGAVSSSIGSFAGGIPLPVAGYRNPVMLASTDGVGTKLLVARRLNDYSTVGIDLVAMCVNDLAVCGADPLIFLDYIACGALHEELLHDVIAGVVKGCELAGCTLAGGETAEMPDMYGHDEIDLAGFSVGIVEADAQLPKVGSVSAGDVILGLPSAGMHSNGFSLARRVLEDADDETWKQMLLPTRIYVNELARVRTRIKAAAHITGGGLEGNLARVLPQNLGMKLRWTWPVPPIFASIQSAGDVALQEMRAVFNMGIGIALVVSRNDVAEVAGLLGPETIELGEVSGG